MYSTTYALARHERKSDRGGAGTSVCEQRTLLYRRAGEQVDVPCSIEGPQSTCSACSAIIPTSGSLCMFDVPNDYHSLFVRQRRARSPSAVLGKAKDWHRSKRSPASNTEKSKLGTNLSRDTHNGDRDHISPFIKPSPSNASKTQKTSSVRRSAPSPPNLFPQKSPYTPPSHPTSHSKNQSHVCPGERPSQRDSTIESSYLYTAHVGFSHLPFSTWTPP